MKKNDFGHVMIDIETMGIGLNSPIISIGAVEFNINSGQTNEVFNRNIDLQSCIDLGFIPNASTIMWWLQQSDEARKLICSKQGNTLIDVLKDFFTFIQKCGGQDVQVWGNGSTFDISTLQYAYETLKMSTPWKYSNVRDVRTVVALNSSIKQNTEFKNIQHDAVSDALHQIEYLSKTYNTIKIV